jgi:hypothetical protein
MRAYRCDECRVWFKRRADWKPRSATGGVLCTRCSRLGRVAGRTYPDRLTGRTLTCEQCGTEFYRKASAIRAGLHFCGAACKFAWQREHPTNRWIGSVDNSGERNGRYRHGKRVGENTNARAGVRREVAERDGDWCLLCGKPPKGLHLHRVWYGSQGGRYVTGNCVQLCAHHHAVVHGEKRRWQTLLLRYLADDNRDAVLRQLRSMTYAIDFPARPVS